MYQFGLKQEHDRLFGSANLTGEPQYPRKRIEKIEKMEMEQFAKMMKKHKEWKQKEQEKKQNDQKEHIYIEYTTIN